MAFRSSPLQERTEIRIDAEPMLLNDFLNIAARAEATDDAEVMECLARLGPGGRFLELQEAEKGGRR